jgi:2-alkyl-3-oxoalkanoate reductase
VKAGHTVTGTTRNADKAEAIRTAGAAPAVADALDARAVREAVTRAKPGVVIHELTAIPGSFNIGRFYQAFAATNCLRMEGTDHLLAAALAVGAGRFIAQSYAGWPFARVGGPVKTEDDPFDSNPPSTLRNSLEAIRHLERAVTDAEGIEGIVLRYAGFYGPGNTIGEGGALLAQIRKRRVAIVGKGRASVHSFISRTRRTLRSRQSGAAREFATSRTTNPWRYRNGCGHWWLTSAQNRLIEFRLGWSGSRLANPGSGS